MLPNIVNTSGNNVSCFNSSLVKLCPQCVSSVAVQTNKKNPKTCTRRDRAPNKSILEIISCAFLKFVDVENISHLCGGIFQSPSFGCTKLFPWDSALYATVLEWRSFKKNYTFRTNFPRVTWCPVYYVIVYTQFIYYCPVYITHIKNTVSQDTRPFYTRVDSILSCSSTFGTEGYSCVCAIYSIYSREPKKHKYVIISFEFFYWTCFSKHWYRLWLQNTWNNKTSFCNEIVQIAFLILLRKGN